MSTTGEKSSKEALLDAAQLLFSTRGYTSVSTRELAEAAKVNLGSIQYYYGSKAKLFMAAVKRLMGEVEELRTLCSSSRSTEHKYEAVEGLKKLIGLMLGSMLCVEGPQACKLMFREVLSDADQDPELMQEIITTAVDEFMQPTRETFEHLVKIIQKELDQEQLVLAVDSIIGQCVYYATHRPFIEHMRGHRLCGEEQIKKIANHIVEFSLRGLNAAEIGT